MAGLRLVNLDRIHEYRVGDAALYYREATEADRLSAVFAALAAGNRTVGEETPAEKAAFYAALVARVLVGWSGVEDPTGRVPPEHATHGPRPDPAVAAEFVQRLRGQAENLLIAVGQAALAGAQEAEAGLLGNLPDGSSSATSTPA